MIHVIKKKKKKRKKEKADKRRLLFPLARALNEHKCEIRFSNYHDVEYCKTMRNCMSVSAALRIFHSIEFYSV
jgi:gamma-glutamyl phosphate reductase